MLPAYSNKTLNKLKDKFSADFAYGTYFFFIFTPATLISASICLDSINQKYDNKKSGIENVRDF